MNKSELIEAVAEKLGEGRGLATRAVDTVFDEISKAVAAGEKVALTGFGVFEKRDRAARTARNPATGATVKVKKTSVPAFRAGQGFKDAVSGARKVASAGAGVARGAARGAAKAGGRAGSAATKSAPAKKASKATKSAAKKTTGRR